MGTSRVIAVASGKGGVGKTTSAVNLGAGFAEAGRSVVVVDVDLGMANLRDVLDLAAGPSLHDVLAGDTDLEAAIRSGPDGFDVIAGPSSIEAFGRADPSGLGDLIEELRERYDVVVLDTGAGLSYDAALPLGLADEVVLVTTPDDAALANTATTRDLVDRLDGTLAGVIVNRIGGAGSQAEDVEEQLDLSVLGSVPEDGAVSDTAAEGTPVVVANRTSPAAQSFREIAYGLLDEPLPRDWADDEGGTRGDATPAPSNVPGAPGETGIDDSQDDDFIVADEDPESATPAADWDEEGSDAGDAVDVAEAGSGGSTAPTTGEDSAGDGPGLADAIESAESDPDAAGSGALVGEKSDSGEADDAEESRSFLSKVTGGLFG